MRIVRKHRSRRRGSAMSVVMAMFILVSLAGVAILATVSTGQRQLMHYGLMSRLRIATENGLERTRGRFALVAGVQEDWNTLLPNAGWNTIQTHVIDSCTVVVYGRSIGTAAVPRCRLRAIGQLAGRRWGMEYEFKQTSFGDFAMFTGGTNTQGIPANTKVNGNYYSKPSINFSNATGIEFYRNVATSGTVMNVPDPVYSFKQGYSTGVAEITFQPAVTSFATAKTEAQGTSTIYYKNTHEIIFTGTTFTRVYALRYGTGNNDYTTPSYQYNINIPDNGIIYIENDDPPSGVDAPVGTICNKNSEMRSTTDGLKISGIINNRKITVYCEDQITISNNLTYQSLVSNPDLRRFGEKESPAAKSAYELLGVISQSSVGVNFNTFTPMASSANVTDNASYVAWDGRVWNDTGHQPNQYAIDGVFIGYDWIDRTGSSVAAANKEFWFCGSIISGDSPVNNLLDLCYRTNLDWDWRLEEQDPPFIIKTYGQPPAVIAKTFKSYAP